MISNSNKNNETIKSPQIDQTDAATEEQSQPEKMVKKPVSKKASREEKLAQALRDNLRRRKN